MDIATLLESHRRDTIEAFGDDQLDGLLGQAHDRATIKLWGELYRSGAIPNGEVKPLGQAALTAPVPTRRVKAGSKAAKARASKGAETRRKNLAAKTGQDNPPMAKNPIEPQMSPATHLAPRTTEGGVA